MRGAFNANAIPVMCCWAGACQLAMAARGIREVDDPERRLLHLVDLLHTGVRGEDEDQRIIHLMSGAREAWLTVDGPLRFRTLRSEDMLRTPPATAARPPSSPWA